MQLVLRNPDENGGDGDKWVIVEMQGDLESRVGDPNLEGKFIGDLHYNELGAPVLIIGHHILNGKVSSLEKPFVAIEKEEKGYTVKAVIRKKLVFKARPKPIIANVPKKI